MADELHELIQSLSKAEKRHFKIYASKYGSGNSVHLRLFDAIDELKIYDEKKIRAKFSAEKFVKQLSVAKNYLKEIIGKSLRDNITEEDIDNYITTQLTELKLLAAKNIEHAVVKQIERVKKLAHEYGRWHIMMEVLLMEMNRFALLKEPATAKRNIESVRKELLHAEKQLMNVNAFQHLLYRTRYLAASRNVMDTKKFEKELQELEKNALLKNIAQASSFESKYIFHQVHYQFARMHSHVKKQFAEAQKMAKLIEARSGYIFQKPSVYIGMLDNQLLAIKYMHRLSSALPVIEKIRKVPVRTASDAAHQWRSVTDHTYWYIQYARRYDLLPALIEEILNGIETHRKHIKLQNELNSILCCVEGLIILGNYERALALLLPVINSQKLKGNYFYQMEFRLDFLICHYELGNMDTLQNLARSTYRYFSNAPADKNYNPIFFPLFNDVFKSGDKKTRKEVLLKHREHIKAELKKHNKGWEQLLLWFMDYLEAKANGKTMQEYFG